MFWWRRADFDERYPILIKFNTLIWRGEEVKFNFYQTKLLATTLELINGGGVCAKTNIELMTASQFKVARKMN